MNKLPHHSIKELYTYALAEGEGVGTAYEYFAKRLVLNQWLATLATPKRILIAGLPEKYGCSFDFWLLAKEWQAELIIVDEREEALVKAEKAHQGLKDAGIFTQLQPIYNHLTAWTDLNGKYDLCISSEVLQRLSEPERVEYITTLRPLAPAISIFCPNKDNTYHTSLSGLSGLQLSNLTQLTATPHWELVSGYIDMPPFPPGMTRSEEQREQATTGFVEAMGMWVLAWYARCEQWIPHKIRQRQSHIVYAFMQRK